MLNSELLLLLLLLSLLLLLCCLTVRLSAVLHFCHVWIKATCLVCDERHACCKHCKQLSLVYA